MTAALPVNALVLPSDPSVLDPARMAALGDAEVVELEIAGLEPGMLARAGGHDLHTLRLVVRRLTSAGRRVRFIARLADAQTTPEAFVEAVRELARLSLRSDGAVEVLAPPPVTVEDPWVASALAANVVDPEGMYTQSLAALRRAWADRIPGLPADEALVGERLVRPLDDAPRREVFAFLRQAWLEQEDWPGGAFRKEPALATATRVLGAPETWQKSFRQYTFDAVRRMVLIPTWQCELRCSYCWIPKQDGRSMSVATIERGVEMLLATEQRDLTLQFFGGEALIEYERVRHAIEYGSRRAAEVGKQISFIVSSNGWSLSADKVAWLAEAGVKLELSLDGDRSTQEKYRSSRWRDVSSYDHSIATHAEAILASGIDQYVIMVVHPTNVDAMPDNFFHIADLGFRHIQINNMLGRVWKPHELESWAKGLHRIGQELIARWDRGESLEFINMRHKPMAMRLNGEVTIDHDGTIYGGNAFLHETEHKDKFAVGHLDDLTGVDRYWIDATHNEFLLDWSYRPKVTANNVEVGKVMTSFIRWMGRRGYGADGALPAERPEAAAS